MPDALQECSGLRHPGGEVAQGAHALEIKQRLGHESITVTLDTYGRVLPSLDARVVSGLDAAYEATLGREKLQVDSPVGFRNRARSH